MRLFRKTNQQPTLKTMVIIYAIVIVFVALYPHDTGQPFGTWQSSTAIISLGDDETGWIKQTGGSKRDFTYEAYRFELDVTYKDLAKSKDKIHCHVYDHDSKMTLQIKLDGGTGPTETLNFVRIK